MLDTSRRSGWDETHEIFREAVRRFFEKELVPNMERFDEMGNSDRAFWKKSGDMGLLCPTVPEQYGGPGLDFRYNAIVAEELAYCGSPIGFALQSDINADYILEYGTEDQKMAYLPGMVSGDIISGIAMTEPSGGSDLKNLRTSARKDGDHFIVNGSKTYISNGQNADMFIVAVRTGGAGARGVSLLIIDADMPGFARGKNLNKIGQSSADTSELFFHDMRVPCSAILGEEGRGFAYLMSQLSQERLSIAISSQASAQRAFDEAVAFTKERNAFEQSVFDFQNTRFTLADLSTKLQVGWAHLDWAVSRHIAGDLSATEASATKLWHTEFQWNVADKALQLHGGAGYMNEYMIARLWKDSRVSRIYGGTSEIMMELIGRSI